MVRTLIVDDTRFVLAQLEELVTTELGFEVVGKALHGLQAVDLASALRPDLITLDVRMPVMNGLVALKHILSQRPVPVVMVSSFTREDSHLTFDCLRCGALDFVPKPAASGDGGLKHQKDLIVQRIERAAAMDAPEPRYCRLRRRQPLAPTVQLEPATQLMLVNAGRGSVAPLLKLFNEIPLGLGLASIVVFDTPVRVVESFALYLSKFTGLSIRVPRGREELVGERVYFVPSTSSVELRSGRSGVELIVGQDQDGKNGRGAGLPDHRALAEQALSSFGQRTSTIILSGAGPEGVQWAEMVHQGGGLSAAQAPTSAISPDGLTPLIRAGGPAIIGNPFQISTMMTDRLMERV